MAFFTGLQIVVMMGCLTMPSRSQIQPECNNVTLDSQANLTWTCIGEIWSTCSFAFRYPGSQNYTKVSNLYIENVDGKDKLARHFNITRCSMKLPVQELHGGGSGDYGVIFQLSWWKNSIKELFNMTQLIELEVPQVALSDSCPTSVPASEALQVRDGFIKKGARASCRCFMTKEGKPKGYAAWYRTDNHRRIRPEGGNYSVATLYLGPNVTDTTFECRGVSALGHSNVSYTPKFARGPTQIKVAVQTSPPLRNSKNLDICPETLPEVNVSCLVLKSDVAPKPRMYIYHQWANGESENFNCSKDDLEDEGDSWVCTRKLQTLAQGAHGITCVGINSVFEDIKAPSKTNFYVREPSSVPPELFVVFQESKSFLNIPRLPYYSTDSQNTTSTTAESIVMVNATEGETLRIGCSVSDGTPKSDYLMACKGREFSLVADSKNESPFIQLSPLTMEHNGVECWCFGFHVTSCYWNNRSSTIELKVEFNPDLYTGNEQSDDHMTPVIIGTVCVIAIVIALTICGLVVIVLKRKERKPDVRSQFSTEPASDVVTNTNRAFEPLPDVLANDPHLVVVDNSELYGKIKNTAIILNDSFASENLYSSIKDPESDCEQPSVKGASELNTVPASKKIGEANCGKSENIYSCLDGEEINYSDCKEPVESSSQSNQHVLKQMNVTAKEEKDNNGGVDDAELENIYSNVEEEEEEGEEEIPTSSTNVALVGKSSLKECLPESLRNDPNLVIIDNSDLYNMAKS